MILQKIKRFSIVCLITAFGLLIASQNAEADGYSGNEVYSYSVFDHKNDMFINTTWYRRYDNGAFIEFGVNNIGDGEIGAIGYQFMDESTVIDFKFSTLRQSTMSIMKRF